MFSLETVQNYVETVFRVFLTVFHFFYDFPFKKGRDLKYRVEFTKYRFTIFLYRFNPKVYITLQFGAMENGDEIDVVIEQTGGIWEKNEF